ncbi:TPA: phage tail spike protein [Streptococcus suis]
MIYLKDGNIPLNLAYDDDIVQEANSTYQLSFKFPLTDEKWHLLKREVFLLADDLHGEQEFFIFEVKKAKGHVQVYAKQVATLLNYYSIDSISVDRVPGQTAMTALAGSIKRNCPFTFFSDIMDRHTFNESNVSVMDALAKEKHSIVGQWGGDLVRDKYQVKLLKNGGIENESLFMYKKNLSSYEESENINSLKTRLHLKKTIQGQSEGEEDRVIAVTVDSPLISQYSQIYEADIEVNDQDVTDEASLLAYGQRYFSSTLCDLVENSIHLDVKGKSDVSVKMFDTVSVFHERFDVDLRLKITSYHFGPMSKRLKSIGFGKVSQSFGSAVAGMVASSVDRATGAVVASFEQKLQKEIDNANRHFDAEFDKRVESINDGIEQAKAEAELYADNIKQSIDADINAVNQSMQAQSEEHDRQVADILSKTQSIESLANEAKTDAASAITTALQSKDEAIADARAQVATVSQALNTAKTDLQNLATYQETVDRKLTELTSNTRTLDGKINTASAKVDTVAGQILTELTRVEGKIPSDLGGRNYILKSDVYATSGSRYFDTSPEFIDYAYSGKYVTISLDIKGENLVPDSRGLSRIGCELRLNLSDGKVLYLQCQKIVSGTQPRERISVTRKIPEGVSVVSANKVNMYVQVGGTALAGRPKFELSSIPSDWSAAPEDINSELSSTKTLITQTAEGQTQLSNRLTTTQDKVSTAETKINQLIGDVSSKVSQTDYNTLTGRVDSAETAIAQNAQEISKRLTSTQIESAITSKGYQTKAQVDNNITGRGYITSSALQPYALSTTVQNLVKETSDSFSRTISETKALIPTEMSGNLLLESNVGWSNAHDKSYRLADKLEKGKTYTLVAHYWHGEGATAFTSTVGDGAWNRLSYNPTIDSWMVTFKAKADIPSNWSVYLASHPETALGNATFVTLVKGTIPLSRWEPAYSELATVTALHSVRDTVDSHTRTIGAVGESGSILDNVSKVTQTANGLVQEVTGEGGLKTQVSQLAGSYAIKNLTNSGTVLNQLNLNKDGSVKIDGKLVQITGTTYIQDGVISSAKIGSLDAGKITTGTLDAARIKANSIDGSKLTFDEAFFNGLTANEAELKKLFAKDAFITQVQAVTLSASKISGGILSAMNDAMQMDLNNANISFNTNATINFNSANNALVRRRGTHTAFLHFNDVASSADANAGGVYAGLGVTSSGDGINSESSGRFSGIRIFRSAIGYNHNATLDHVELYGDTIYLKDGFDESRGYVFKTVKMANQTIDMNLYINAIKAIAHCLNHLRANNWDWKLPNLQTAVSGLMDSYINKTDFFNKLQV